MTENQVALLILTVVIAFVGVGVINLLRRRKRRIKK